MNGNFRGMLVEDLAVPAGATFGLAKGMSNLPPGAVQLTQQQMQSILEKTINNWTPIKDMYPLKYGNLIQAFMAGASGFIFNDFFRKGFKLGHRHKLVSFAPSVMIPACTTLLLQRALVTTPMVLGELDCPVCAETRSVSLQVATGFLQPLILGFVATAIIAKNDYTTEVPPLTDFKKVAKLFRRMIRPVLPHFTVLLALNVLSSSYLTYTQGRSVLQVRERIFGPPRREELSDN